MSQLAASLVISARVLAAACRAAFSSYLSQFLDMRCTASISYHINQSHAPHFLYPVPVIPRCFAVVPLSPTFMQPSRKCIFAFLFPQAERRSLFPHHPPHHPRHTHAGHRCDLRERAAPRQPGPSAKEPDGAGPRLAAVRLLPAQVSGLVQPVTGNIQPLEATTSGRKGVHAHAHVCSTCAACVLVQFRGRLVWHKPTFVQLKLAQGFGSVVVAKPVHIPKLYKQPCAVCSHRFPGYFLTISCSSVCLTFPVEQVFVLLSSFRPW